MMPNMPAFMLQVAQMASVRLPLFQQKRLEGTLFTYTAHDDPLYHLIGHVPLGDSLCKVINGKPFKEIRLFDKGLCQACEERPDVSPFRIAAFTVIHECGHMVMGKSRTERDEHDDPMWVKACRDMGINEIRYSEKGEDWGYNFEFLDQELWQRIQAIAPPHLNRMRRKTLPPDTRPKWWEVPLDDRGQSLTKQRAEWIMRNHDKLSRSEKEFRWGPYYWPATKCRKGVDRPKGVV